jgi:exodeoxyribonuclease X
MRFNVLDLETTDDGPEAEVIEIASCLVEGTQAEVPETQLFNYIGEMAPAARATHCLEDAELRGFPVASGEVLTWFACALYAGGSDEPICVAHNSEFEQLFLGRFTPGVQWLCTYKAALRVWPDAPRHSNGVLYYWLRDQGKVPDLGGAAHPMHRAGPDTWVTAHILLALLEEASAEDMIQWTKEPRLMPTCPIGKFRGKPWPEVEGGFLGWMLRQDDMEADLKWNAKRELDRRAAQ